MSSPLNTHRGAMSIWLMKTPQLEVAAMVVERVRKVTVRTWLQPTKVTATRRAAAGTIPAESRRCEGVEAV